MTVRGQVQGTQACQHSVVGKEGRVQNRRVTRGCQWSSRKAMRRCGQRSGAGPAVRPRRAGQPGSRCWGPTRGEQGHPWGPLALFWGVVRVGGPCQNLQGDPCSGSRGTRSPGRTRLGTRKKNKEERTERRPPHPRAVLGDQAKVQGESSSPGGPTKPGELEGDSAHRPRSCQVLKIILNSDPQIFYSLQ